MKHKSIKLTSLIAACVMALSFQATADDHASDERKELNREHRKEMREMRRHHKAERMLMRVDANKDGQVDLNEYLAHAQERFAKLDVDGNGFVTPGEAESAMKQMREEHKERRKQRFKERANRSE